MSQDERVESVAEAAYKMGQRDGKYGLARFPHLRPEYQSDYNRGYDEQNTALTSLGEKYRDTVTAPLTLTEEDEQKIADLLSGPDVTPA